MSEPADGLTSDRDGAALRRRCETIIHASSAAAAAAASVTIIPGSDAVAIMPIQVAMVAGLAREYGIAPSASLVKSTVYASLGSIVGKAGAGLLTRMIPFAGNVVRASVALSVTEALGHLVLERLERGEGLA
jgi:uncharacterized protein (DUF697 family)